MAHPRKNPQCAQAGVAHLGVHCRDLRLGKRRLASIHPEKPFVLLAQQSLFDPSRAPEGKHTLWAYCHVPNGSPSI
jgi:phytoene dehydrogenase-like protein